MGDAKSLVIHPASTTHHRVDEASLLASGIGPGLVRLSIGLEDAKDLINDLKSGLEGRGEIAQTNGSNADGERVVNIQLDGKNVGFSNGSGHPAEDAPALFFVHGAGMDHTVWVIPARYFARHGYRVLAADLPGGESRKGRHWTR